MAIVMVRGMAHFSRDAEPAVYFISSSRPDFVGRKNDSARQAGIENGRKVIEIAMQTKGNSAFIAGELSLADPYLAPIAFYVSLTPDKDAVFNVAGFAEWWAKVLALPSLRNTQPNPG